MKRRVSIHAVDEFRLNDDYETCIYFAVQKNNYFSLCSLNYSICAVQSYGDTALLRVGLTSGTNFSQEYIDALDNIFSAGFNYLKNKLRDIGPNYMIFEGKSLIGLPQSIFDNADFTPLEKFLMFANFSVDFDNASDNRKEAMIDMVRSHIKNYEYNPGSSLGNVFDAFKNYHGQAGVELTNSIDGLRNNFSNEMYNVVEKLFTFAVFADDNNVLGEWECQEEIDWMNIYKHPNKIKAAEIINTLYIFLGRKKLLNFLDNLSAERFRRISEMNLAKSMNLQSVINKIELETENEYFEKTAHYKRMIQDFCSSSVYATKYYSDIADFRKKLLSIASHHNTIDVILYDVKNYSGIFSDSVEIFVQGQTGKWITPSFYIEEVLEKMLAGGYSYEDILDIVYAVCESEKVPRYKNWIEYASNYETYSEMPIPWRVNII